MSNNTNISLQELQKVNDTLRVKFVYQFGRGVGFCADYIWLLTCLIKCIEFKIGFYLGRSHLARGFVIKNGWSDYFKEVFHEVDAPMIERLNLTQFPLSEKLPIIRKPVKLWLTLFSKPRINYVMSDNLGRLRKIESPIWGKNISYQVACHTLLTLLWRYQNEVEQEVGDRIKALGLPDKYIALHVRRGDKLREYAYVHIAEYICLVESIPEDIKNVYVATDDLTVITEIKRHLKGYNIMWAEKGARGNGYDQKTFNSLPSSARFSGMLDFFAEIEIMKSAKYFVGSSTTNVAMFIDMHRSGKNVLWTENTVPNYYT